MLDSGWIVNELVGGALRPACAPAHWLARLANAVSELTTLADAAGPVDVFRRPPPLSDLDLTAALRGAVPPPTSEVEETAKAQEVARVEQRPPSLPRPRGRVAGASGDSVRRARMMRRPFSPHAAQAAGNSARGASDTGVSASAAASRTDKLPGASAVAPSFQGDPSTVRPWAMQEKTVSVNQLKAMLGRTSSTGSPAAHERSKANRPAPGRATIVAPDSTTKAGLLDALARPTQSASSGDAVPGRTGQVSTGFLRKLKDALPNRTEATTMLLARLTEPAKAEGSATRSPVVSRELAGPAQAEGSITRLPVVSHDLTGPGAVRHVNSVLRPAVARAFGAGVGHETFSTGQLSALAKPAQTRSVGPGTRSKAASPSSVRVNELAQTPPASARPDIEPARNVGETGELQGIALLRKSVSHLEAPAKTTTLAQAGGAVAERQNAKTGASESPRVPVTRNEIEAAPSLVPAVQNTFNVTVHMEGGLEGSEDELAERLGRILAEQARRYGIDV